MVHNNFSKIIINLESDQYIPNTNGGGGGGGGGEVINHSLRTYNCIVVTANSTKEAMS